MDDTITLVPRLSSQNMDIELVNKALAIVNPFTDGDFSSPSMIKNKFKRRSAWINGEKTGLVSPSQNILKILRIDSAEGREGSSFIDCSIRGIMNIVTETCFGFDGDWIKTDDFSTISKNSSAGESFSPLEFENGSLREKEHSAVSVLRVRDLRRLDYLFSPVDEANIIVRRHVVQLSFDPIRALIMANKLIIIVPDGSEKVVQVVGTYMSEWRKEQVGSEHHITFEIHAYEALFTTISSIQLQDFNLLKRDVDEALSYFRHGAIIPVDVQEAVRFLKNEVDTMKARISGHKRALLDLMEDDEVMALMNLTKLSRTPSLYSSPLSQEILSCHEEIEDIFEVYLMDFNALDSKIDNLRLQIQSSEESVSLRLDTSRNEILVVNTAMIVLACCIAFESYIGGIFGMNLDNTTTIQPVPGIFYTVFSVSFVLIFVSFALIITYFTQTGIFPKKVVMAHKSKSVLSLW